MVDFLPFDGLLPKIGMKDAIEDRVSPPYDVISEETLRILQSKPYNITRITLGAEDGNYAKAADLFEDWISKGKLVVDEDECYYVIQQTFSHEGKEVTRTGLMGALRLEPYDTGNISPHEETFPKVKEDRLNLLRATKSHLESIFCLYDRMEAGLTRDVFAKMETIFEVTDKDGTRHVFGRISNKTLIEAIKRELGGKRLLIADGHHRYETALRYSTENPGDPRKGYVLATMIAGNDPGLVVLPTHRIFSGVQIATEEFLHHASKFFAIWEVGTLEEVVTLTTKNDRPSLGVLMADGRKFVFELAWKPTDDPLWSVDAYVCEELVMNKILKKKGEVKVDFDHEATSVAEKMGGKAGCLAVLLSPPKLEVIWQVAKEGEKMPRKSTYFYPKVWSGFVVYRMG